VRTTFRPQEIPPTQVGMLKTRNNGRGAGYTSEDRGFARENVI
jgi:hypothetical protein